MDADVVVVGGGPVGCHTAGLLAKRMRVVVVEEHREVGRPVQCTGLISPEVLRLAAVRPRIINELRGAVIHFPGGCELDVSSHETKAVVIDRGEFDRLVCERALDAGVEVVLGNRVDGFERTDVGIVALAGDRRLEAEVLVGADGHRSVIADLMGAGAPREFVYGIQMDIVHRMEEQSIIDIHVGNEVAPGFFAWSIPCGDFTRVGLVVDSEHAPPNEYLRRYLGALGLEGRERLRMISGRIPIGPRPRTFADRVMLIGDAAGQAKPVSGGGLYPGLVAARCLVETVEQAFDFDDLSARTLAHYQERWRASIGRELDRGYMLRKVYRRMSDRKLDEACRALGREDIRDILSRGDIDHPSALAGPLLRAMPSLVRFSPEILGSLLTR